MSPEDLIEFSESALALDLPNAKRAAVLGYSHADEHGYLEAPLRYRELQCVRIPPLYIGYVDRIAATVDDHRDLIFGSQRVVQ